MSAERININGIWYVKEQDDLTNTEDSIKIDPTDYYGSVVENDDYCFEATKLVDYNIGIDIKFTDKRSKPWREDNWDNMEWLKGVLNGNQDSLKQLHELNPEGKVFFIKFLQYLRDEKEWL